MSRLRLLLVLALGICLLSAGWTLLAPARQKPIPRLSVEVLNGCGEDGLAARAAARLRALGCDVLRVEDAPRDDFSLSLLIDRRGKPTLSRRLASRIGPVQVLLERIDPSDCDVTLVLGGDQRTLALWSIGPGSEASLGR